MGNKTLPPENYNPVNAIVDKTLGRVMSTPHVSPEWCKCGCCRYETGAFQVCCNQSLCITNDDDFEDCLSEPTFLDLISEPSLFTVYTPELGKMTNHEKRLVCHRRVFRKIHGTGEDRVILPSCCVHQVKLRYDYRSESRSEPGLIHEFQSSPSPDHPTRQNRRHRTHENEANRTTVEESTPISNNSLALNVEETESLSKQNESGADGVSDHSVVMSSLTGPSSKVDSDQELVTPSSTTATVAAAIGVVSAAAVVTDPLRPGARSGLSDGNAILSAALAAVAAKECIQEVAVTVTMVAMAIAVAHGFIKFRRKTRRPRGIDNVNQSCFINASLQCVAACVNVFSDDFSLPKKIQDPDQKYQGVVDIGRVRHVDNPLEQVLQRLWSRGQGSIGRPTAFLDDIHLRVGEMRARGSRQLDMDTPVTALVSDYLMDDPHGSLFFVDVIERKTCVHGCGFHREHHNPCEILRLQMSDIEGQSLTGLLERFFQPRIDNFPHTCPTAQNRGEERTIVHSRIDQPPKFLMILLLRYEYTRVGRSSRRFDCRVSYPQEFRSPLLNNTKYDLLAVGLHSGTMDFGHYFARVRYGSTWFQCDDNAVEEINGPSVNADDAGRAYMLFYGRADGAGGRE